MIMRITKAILSAIVAFLLVFMIYSGLMWVDHLVNVRTEFILVLQEMFKWVMSIVVAIFMGLNQYDIGKKKK